MQILIYIFFFQKNEVKNLVKMFQCVTWATAYLPTHSLKSPAFLVPATFFVQNKHIGKKILSKRSSVWCVLLLTYPLTHSSLQPFWCQLLWMMKGRTQTFRPRRRTAAGATIAPCRRGSRRIIHECSWKPVGHGTHFKPFITSRVPTFLSICLSVCLMW